MIEIPHNREIEARLLGAFISSPEILRKHAQEIHEALFHSPAYSRIWKGIKASHSKHGHAKLLTLYAILRESGDLDAVGGSTELTRIAVSPERDQVPAFLHILTENAKARALIRIASRITTSPDLQSLGADDLIPEIRTEIDRIESMSAKEPAFRLFNDNMCDLLQYFCEINEGRQEQGISTGFHEIDKMLNGMKAGQMIVLAARPSLGKTGLGMNMAVNMAQNGVPVGVFSLEMSTKELMARIIAAEARVSLRTAEDIRKYTREIDSASMRVRGIPLLIDDTPRLTVSEIRKRAIEMQVKHGIKILCIDYAQLIKGEGLHKNGNREQEVAGVSRGIKAMAKELGIPVILLAQLNRAAEGRERPNLSQLRESGQLENDADVVAFIHRDRQAQQTIKDGESVPADIIIEKNRSGPCGVVHVAFFPHCCRFDNAIHSFGQGDGFA